MEKEDTTNRVSLKETMPGKATDEGERRPIFTIFARHMHSTQSQPFSAPGLPAEVGSTIHAAGKPAR
jgi:hypothetical protein